jgi:hypothetical protein
MRVVNADLVDAIVDAIIKERRQMVSELHQSAAVSVWRRSGGRRQYLEWRLGGRSSPNTLRLKTASRPASNHYCAVLLTASDGK